MSSENPSDNQNIKNSSSKSFTGAFEQETKIRLIIQDVLNATMRKISNLQEKVSGFQEFFFTFKQRIIDIEDKSGRNQHSIERIIESINKNRADAQADSIKLQQENEKIKIQLNQKTETLKEINKKLTNITRQNENLNNQISKTKAKFLQYNQQMTNVKEEVSWKISKYVQQTAQVNTNIKLGNQQIKKQYFNLQLALNKNQQKYDKIIESKDEQQRLNEKFQLQIEEFTKQLQTNNQQIKGLNKKLQDMDSAIYAKMKTTENKLNQKIQDLFESNKRISESVKKLDTFSQYLEEVKEDAEKIKRQFLKKFEEMESQNKNKLEHEIIGVNQAMLDYEKKTDRKIRGLNECQQKNVDFFTQKLDFLKVEIQTEISSKASKMMEEKSKNEVGVAKSALQQIQDRISKLSLETMKNVGKIQATLKQLKNQVKNNLEDMKDYVETKITKAMHSMEQSKSSGISPQFVQSINDKIEQISDRCELKIFEMNKDLQEQGLKVLAVERMKEETKDQFGEMVIENKKAAEELDDKLTGQLQKIMFLVTKMRGDAIIRNQFADKEIKELKRISAIYKQDFVNIFKLVPAIGQCINLIMCLIFDAEFQHSKIIQQTLPNSNKDALKFTNVIQGVLYEYSEKKKPGIICYRHKDLKKTDIVGATFNAYIQVWEDIFLNDEKKKEKQDLIPKSFYKKNIEKNVGKTAQSSAIRNKDMSQPLNSNLAATTNQNKQIYSSKQLGKNQQSKNSMNVESQQNLNKSFTIRKKKTTNVVRSKQDMIMVVQEEQK